MIFSQDDICFDYMYYMHIYDDAEWNLMDRWGPIFNGEYAANTESHHFVFDPFYYEVTISFIKYFDRYIAFFNLFSIRYTLSSI